MSAGSTHIAWWRGRATWAIFIMALAMRLVSLAALRPSGFLATVISDGASYDAWARQIANGDWIGKEVFYQAPLYPYFLATCYRLFGHDWFVVRVIQCVLGSVGCAMLADSGKRWFSPRAGVVAGLIWALYPPAVFHDLCIEKSSIGMVLWISAIWLLSRSCDRATFRQVAGVGFLLGLLSLVRENALAMVPLIGLWYGLRAGTTRHRLTLLLCFGAGISAALLPVAARNYRVGGEALLTTSQFGPNFFIGNRQGATGLYGALAADRGDAAFEARDARRLAESDLKRRLTSGEVSSYWTRRALQEIGRSPADWLGLMSRKILLTLGRSEIADSESIEAYSDWAVLLRYLGLVLNFGIIAPVAIWGAWAAIDRWREWWILAALAVMWFLSVAAFFVFARYRLPLAAVLVQFAGAGISSIRSPLEHGTRRTIGALLTAGTIAILSNLVQPTHEDPRIETYNNYGMVLLVGGRADQAAMMFERATALAPGDALSHHNLGMAILSGGDAANAIRHFDAAIAAEPSGARWRRARGDALLRLNRASEAREELERAHKLDPESESIRALLSEAERRASGGPTSQSN